VWWPPCRDGTAAQPDYFFLFFLSFFDFFLFFAIVPTPDSLLVPPWIRRSA
jgi:hypothetical protein